MNFWDLADFIYARLDEAGETPGNEAMRKIAQRCARLANEMDVYPNGLVSPRALLARQVLMDIAAVHNDHPEWKL